METKTVYKIAEDNKVSINFFPLPRSKALSICCDDGSCHIAIDPAHITGEADEKVKVCHELGHCITGSFYYESNYCDVYGRHEYRANKWAFKQLIPQDELFSVVERGIVSPWELADYFGVTEGFIRKACDYYLSITPMA
ncbi:ImmA/IrrE family metallo-endopeptidase [Acetanaerobacterium elongatum]|uniref:IrrE N-terminal-like domain-containing protein n=1 Tax=Acetanaerobacterium elongatum TaxID=258515 RepID=A0A1G9YY40_9FIRM|nr:ImmA/IrrE family metallo-endopeptidase [Acetanaerobacterium elongatum]SDN14010.1 protein of unknown function [Acetanaerobacterium elongatum]